MEPEGRLETVESILGVRFLDRTLLETVLKAYTVVGRSKTRYQPLRGSPFDRNKFQYLAILGDRVIWLVVTETADWTITPNIWSKTVSKLVSNRHLADIFDQLGLFEYLDLTGRKPRLPLGYLARASTYEALVGAIYLDQGFDKAKAFVGRTLLSEASR
jgi:dsRNA-specific ribonuclease